MTESYDRRRLRVYNNMEELLVLNWPTPLVRLQSLSSSKFEAWAKLEFYNPFSRSIKDRAVWNMFRVARGRGALSDKLYEATSGNVGIALASLSNIYGKRFTAFLPRGAPETTETLLKILGARVVRTSYASIDWVFIRDVEEKARREGAVNLNQFVNEANFQAHYEFTSTELVEQLRLVGKEPVAVIAGIGTSGHIAAITKRLRENFREIKVIGVQPVKGDTIPGIKRVETGPKWLSQARLDGIVDVSRLEAVREVVYVARREGLLIGLSSGAVVSAYKKVREEVGGGLYVMVFPDDIFKYIGIVGGYLESLKEEGLGTGK